MIRMIHSIAKLLKLLLIIGSITTIILFAFSFCNRLLILTTVNGFHINFHHHHQQSRTIIRIPKQLINQQYNNNRYYHQYDHIIPYQRRGSTKKYQTFQLYQSYSNNNNNNNNNDKDSNNKEQIIEAVQSMTDFHQGIWYGKSIQSFSISNDIAAGIVQRFFHHIDQDNNNIKSLYESNIQIGYNSIQKDFQMIESIEWSDDDNNNSSGDRIMTVDNKNNYPLFSKRNILWSPCYVDVDVVDASYSLHMTILNQQEVDKFVIEHCIATSDITRSRCFAFYNINNDNNKNDNQQQSLKRIVICEETKNVNDKTKNDSNDQIMNQFIDNNNNINPSILLPKDIWNDNDQTFGDNDIIKILRNNNNNDNDFRKQYKQQQEQQDLITSSPLYTLYPMNLWQICNHNGIWKGDSVIRDIPSVMTSPIIEMLQQQKSKNDNNKNKKWFGLSSSPSSSTTSSSSSMKNQNNIPPPFGQWNIGVQKVAWQYIWNEQQDNNNIHYKMDYGTSIGICIDESIFSSIIQNNNLNNNDNSDNNNNPILLYQRFGTICLNESVPSSISSIRSTIMSKRRRNESRHVNDRIIYIDWDDDNVGFFVGSTMILLPRYLQFDRTRQLRPFYTEFSVFQIEKDTTTTQKVSSLEDDEEMGSTTTTTSSLPSTKVVCSKISRLYNYEGKLKQGITSFVSWKPLED